MDLRETQTIGVRRHPWEVARFRFFYEVLRRHGLTEHPARIVDVGAGDAWFAAQLLARMPPKTEMVCWDTNYDEAATKSTEGGIVRTATKPSGLADVVLLLDVLEHIDDDRGFLTSLVRENARPGARVLVSVPAWGPLFSAHDVYLKHFRRYSPEEGARLVEGAGLQILARGGLFHSLLLPRAVTKVSEMARAALGQPREIASESAWGGGELVTRALGTALAVDNFASHALAKRGIEAPGLSWWALCTTS